MVMTMSASCQESQSISTMIPVNAQVPKVKSRIDHAITRERLEQSLVIRAISQPTALRS